MTPVNFLDLPPLLSARGTVTLPGSKSISNRVLLLAALSEGSTEVRDVLLSDDTERMLDGLRTLGVGVEKLDNHVFRVQGCAGNFTVNDAELFLGNAGTAFRPLTAALALSGGHYKLSGVSRMHERPIGDLVDALRALGANIDYLGNDGFPPLEIFPATLSGVARVSVRGDVSSQFLTALLMALPLLDREVAVEVVGELISKPYIEITLAMMARFGVTVRRDGWRSFTVAAGSRYATPGVIYVEGDASSASYFLAAGAIGGGPVRIEGVGSDSIQGDVRFADALALMGAQVERGPNWMEARAPANGKLKAIDLDCNHIPDAAMTLAVAALFADGTTTLRNIASWRVKETDRIAAMVTELRKVGATVEEGADYIRVTPPRVGSRIEERGSSENQTPPSLPLSGEESQRSPHEKGELEGVSLDPRSSLLNPATGIDTYDDHRMAMCFSLAAFGAEGIRINDPHCVTKTFPDYFARFREVAQAVPVIAIDGPSASGKGTVAQRVAAKLGYHYLDSGALYRLLAMAAQRDGIALTDETGLAALAGRMEIRFEGEQIWLDGALAGDELRGEQCAAAASKVAAFPRVRDALLSKQHAFRRAPGLVADGRDMSSVVFPDAAIKIFLTASAEARAERRYKQLKEKGMDANITALLLDIHERDERDTRRSVAPLQQAVGANLLDTTALNIEQAVQEVLARYLAKGF
ncbi:MAG: cytidylate kinase [Gallionellales bacterium RIFCSPLOWO2_12_FULL_57_18]|nr:MAG: cytidylate kinase [Gallionellales bacterium RIFCSPLOWO2_12_FULL_57_18]OGS96943.1 MAG: cytidylate kinase [Gallionellales bacterium RIFCSPLOWO2_02_FULL_57_47]OGT10277.1 MAG: cytidylate kinase [Gallionellales bacterium RIFCSPHIGHO2_02_FULL_57_16]